MKAFLDNPFGPIVACDWRPIIRDGLVYRNTTDTQCFLMVQSVINTKNGRQILFMGDSTMYKLWKEARVFQKRQSFPSRMIATSRCDWLKSFGIKPSKVWEKPNLTKEGPAAYGLENHWCTDCSGCNSHVLFIKEGPDSQILLTDYIAVEFSRDVEMQSDLGNTTQETISRYLLLQNKFYSLCVMNEGAHDQALVGLQTEDYVANVIEFLDLVSPVCKHVLWIEMTAPRGDIEYDQSIEKTRIWNMALLLHFESHPHIWSLMRVFKSSLKAIHVDNVHLHHSWYIEMARTMFGQLEE